MQREVITFKGNKKLWNKFVAKLKKDHNRVSLTLEKYMENYLKKK